MHMLGNTCCDLDGTIGRSKLERRARLFSGLGLSSCTSSQFKGSEDDAAIQQKKKNGKLMTVWHNIKVLNVLNMGGEMVKLHVA